MLLLISIEKKETYIDNIRHEDFQPNLVGIDIQVGGMLSHNEHLYHMARSVGMGQDIDFQCKPCCQDIHYHADILLF